MAAAFTKNHKRHHQSCFGKSLRALVFVAVIHGLITVFSIRPLMWFMVDSDEKYESKNRTPKIAAVRLGRNDASGTRRKKKVPPEPSILHENTTHVCAPWTRNMDTWWTHHPEWVLDFENDTMFCFVKQPDTPRTRLYKQVYDLQFGNATTNCSPVMTFYMWSSGWGSDFLNIADGLLRGLELQRPFQIDFLPQDMETGWHYAALKDGSKPVCPTKNMFCYFLPLSKCPPGTIDSISFVTGFRSKQINEENWGWLTFYVTREQQWLRRRIYEYLRDKAPPILQPCAVIHVRRADVVLHGEESRKYFAIEDYLSQLRRADGKEEVRNILLVTDDANAVDEALEFHPEYNWMYLNRTRYRGSEGGWENQLPSKEPVEEVVILLAVQRLVRHCDTIVHGQGMFSGLLYHSMRSTGRPIARLRVDEGTSFDTMHSINNTASDKELEQKLEARRRRKQKTGVTNSKNE